MIWQSDLQRDLPVSAQALVQFRAIRRKPGRCDHIRAPVFLQVSRRHRRRRFRRNGCVRDSDKTKRVRISQTPDLGSLVRRAIETHYDSPRLRSPASPKALSRLLTRGVVGGVPRTVGPNSNRGMVGSVDICPSSATLCGDDRGVDLPDNEATRLDGSGACVVCFPHLPLDCRSSQQPRRRTR